MKSLLKSLKDSKYRNSIGYLCVTIIGIIIGVVFSNSAIIKNNKSYRIIHAESSVQTFTNPLLGVNYIDRSNSTYKKIKDSIEKYLSTNAVGDRVSVFFVDLNSGKQFGVNENDTYIPASLLKVPYLIAYLKEAESEPTILSHTLKYTSDIDKELKDIPYASPTVLKVGNSYQVRDLLKIMIAYSDNGAKNLLFKNIDPWVIDNIFYLFKIKSMDSSEFEISPKDLSMFFRVLYNATYLNVQMSEEALAILSMTNYRDGIVKGIPDDIIVAHKYGEYVFENSDKLKKVEFHDCGIVYVPTNPYFLCVMTEGKVAEKIQEHIQNISRMVYMDSK